MSNVLLRCWWLVLVVVGGCFSPQFEDGKIQCGENGSCPPGLTCDTSSNICRSGPGPQDANTFTLTVTPGGNGTGTVTSAPAGIDCGADCTEAYAASTMVTLTASPSAGSQFMGWTGACSGTGTCTVTLASNINVTANFALANSLIVTKAGTGTGLVVSDPSGINCGSDCSEQYSPGTTVVLTALALTNSKFDGWSGEGCTGTGTCTVTLDAARMVTATFSPIQHALTVQRAGNGTGTVTSAPDGIDCGVDCDEVLDQGTMVTLTATPETGSAFAGWSGGGCTGTGTCMVTLAAATTVTATFSLTTFAVTVTKAGNGAGSVMSTPAGINCGSDCTEDFNYNTMVTLNASPSTGSVFMGWSGGGCTGTSACVVTVTQAASVTATFMLTTPALTIEKSGNGSGSVSSNPVGIDCGSDCSENYNYGSMITLSATPSTGSTFTGWSGGGCTGTSDCTVTLNGATTVTATFTLQTRVLSVTKAGTGAGAITSVPAGINCSSGTCMQSFDYGTMVVLTATPALGTTFDGWSGGGCSGNGSCTVAMTAAQAVSATFTLTQHQLTVTKTGVGSGTISTVPAGGGISCGADCVELYGFGTSVTLRAQPATGSSFTGWSGGICTGTGDCTVSVTTATTVTATFGLTTQNLTVTVNGTGAGTVTSAPAGITCTGPSSDCTESYSYGTTVTLSAAAQTGSSFTGWTGGGCSGTGTCVVSMTAATGVTATFTLGTNSMTVAKAGNGSGTVTSMPAGINCGADCSENFTFGTMVTLTATPSGGSSFTSWQNCPSPSGNTCTLTVNSPITVTATFTLDTYALNVTKAGMGTGSVSSIPAGISCGADCTETYSYGTVVTLNASAAGNSTFTGWSGGGCMGTGSCTVTIAAMTTVTATFVPIQYNLGVTKAGNGSGTVTSNVAGIMCGADCNELYNSGTTVMLTAVNDPGSTFTGWSGGGCSGTSTCTVNMTAAATVTATFTLLKYDLTVKVTGSGSVKLDPPAATCSGTCVESYDYGTDVTLIPNAAVGYTFAYWDGAGCENVGTDKCVVTMKQAETVEAVFKIDAFTLSVIKNGTGAANGTVKSNIGSINCGANCADNYDYGTLVTLSATVASGTGTTFNGWSGGGCSGTGTCVVTVDAAKTVTATFTVATYAVTVTKAGMGNGTVASNPSGISCPGTCSASFNHGATVVLTANPAAGSKITWSGACSGSSTTCTLTNITGPRAVTATFDIIPPNYVFVTSTGLSHPFGGLAGADSFCQARASAAGLTGTYRAWLSTSTVNAISRLQGASGWIRRGDNKPVAYAPSEIATERFFYPINNDEFGTPVTGVPILTGTLPSGLVNPSPYVTCNDWTGTPSGNVFAGYPHANSGMFTLFTSVSCGGAARLYCFGVSNAAVVAPPPVSARRAFTTNATFTPGGGIGAADAMCASEASTAGLPGTYKALLATTTSSAIGRFNTANGSLPWARPDHTLVTATPQALTTAALTYLDAAPNTNAAGTTSFGNFGTWSGATSLTAVGTAASTCNDWMSTAGTAGAGGRAGDSRVATWFGFDTSNACNATHLKLVCLQQ